ncbi:MAG: NUDIX domain-containing protein, partial [Ardenticatenales bacterium]
MIVTDTVSWGQSTIELTFERWDPAFDGGDVSSVRAIVLAGDNVLVVTNEHQMHIVPGGRPKQGETHDDALRRELLEETGWTIESA